jgi:hypothetical protein
MSIQLNRIQWPFGGALGVMILVGLTLSSCRSKESATEKRGAGAPATALVSPQASQPIPAASKQDGGDHLPLMVDPNSPGSCALVNKNEMCGQCCSDVFAEDSDPWHLCMDACVKADALRNER